MGIVEAIPYLREIEDVDYVGSSGGGWGDYEPKEGGLDPHVRKDLWVRQLTHLSLRRMGENPGPFPNTYVQTYFEDYRKKTWPEPPALARPRADAADAIITGMIPEQVVELIGYPDFITTAGSTRWEYDMDSPAPYSLRLYWGQEGVSKIEREIPPLWKQGNIRDQAIIN